LIKLIHALFLEAATKAFEGAEIAPETIEITLATQEKFGHYQCNSAMRLAKILHKNPREIAQQMVLHLDQAIFQEVSVEGPGFINLTLSASYLSERLNLILRDPRLGVVSEHKGRRYIVDFSSPNIAKEMHVGHLRSTIIGDSIARLFEFLQADVVRLNHVGDWGTAFGMLIAYLRQSEPEVIARKKQVDLPTLMQFYRASKARFDEDEAFKQEARQSVVALQAGDQQALAAWEMICEISRSAYKEVYSLLDIRIEERGESFYNPMLSDIVADLEEKGLVTLSEGAKCIFHEGIKIPLMLQKSDGGFNYDTTDMAAMVHRINEEKAERIMILTDAGQALHFELVEKTAIAAGYLDPAKVRFDHITFGVVLGTDGKKFRTRSGHVERLMDLLTGAVDAARKILVEREGALSEKELSEHAEILGIDAVKYSDLSCNRKSDYVFSYERMLRFEGNTAAFILYSYVRIISIKRKIEGLDMQELYKSSLISLEHPSEVSLGLHLLRFSDVLEQMAQDLLPNYLTDYLYMLAQKFNQFFRDCRVQGDARQNERLLLCELAARTLEQGLSILGLKTLDRM